MATDFVRIEGLEGVMKTLRQLPDEIAGKNGGPVRTALRRAGVVIQKQALANVDRIIATPNLGMTDDSTGHLRKNIKVSRAKMPAGVKGERQIVRVLKNKPYSPPRAKKEQVTASQVGAMLESGTERRTAMPWMRPAFDAKKEEAVRVFQTDLLKAIEHVQKKLARANGVKGA